MSGLTEESKRRRLTSSRGGPPDPAVGGGFTGATLGELLTHLESTRLAGVKLAVLDHVGAAVAERGPGLDDVAECLTATVEGAFVAKVEGLAGASLGTIEGLDDADRAELDEQAVVTVLPCHVAAAQAGWLASSREGSAGGDGDGNGNENQSSGRADGSPAVGTMGAAARAPSRAHELLTIRARRVFESARAANADVFAAADQADQGGEKGKGGTGDPEAVRRRQLRALDTLVRWLDQHHDVFTAPDPANFGSILAPDPSAGGQLVPARLLHGAP